MSDWFETMKDQFWLHPDEVGEREAQFILKALQIVALAFPCADRTKRQGDKMTISLTFLGG